MSEALEIAVEAGAKAFHDAFRDRKRSLLWESSSEQYRRETRDLVRPAVVAAIAIEREQLEGILARYIQSVGDTEGIDFIRGGISSEAAFIGPDDPVLFRCSGRNERGKITPETEAVAAAIRANSPHADG